MRKDQARTVSELCFSATSNVTLSFNTSPYYERLPIGQAERNYDFLVRMVNRHVGSQITKQVGNEMARGSARAAFPATGEGNV